MRRACDMRLLIAPDAFAGTLDAVRAAEAIAEGWLRRAPDTHITAAPMADGGPGFVDVLHAALGGEFHAVTVSGPDGRSIPVAVLVVGDTAYLESAQACGLHLAETPEPWSFTTVGVGEALLAATRLPGLRRVVVGLGGSATNDGGAGLLAALGATADAPLNAGPAGLRDVTAVDLTAARASVEGIELVIASDVTTPLLGMFGATKTFGPQKGLSEADIIAVDAILDRYVEATCGAAPAERRIADADGAGAAGGLGFALLCLGAQVRSGIALVAEATGLAGKARDHDLVITGEGRFDYSSRAGKVVYGVAQVAAESARPCIVLAGGVDVGAREMRALGVEAAYGVTDRIPAEEALARPYETLADLAERVARTWSR